MSSEVIVNSIGKYEFVQAVTKLLPGWEVGNAWSGPYKARWGLEPIAAMHHTTGAVILVFHEGNHKILFSCPGDRLGATCSIKNVKRTATRLLPSTAKGTISFIEAALRFDNSLEEIQLLGEKGYDIRYLCGYPKNSKELEEACWYLGKIFLEIGPDCHEYGHICLTEDKERVRCLEVPDLEDFQSLEELPVVTAESVVAIEVIHPNKVSSFTGWDNTENHLTLYRLSLYQRFLLEKILRGSEDHSV